MIMIYRLENLKALPKQSHEEIIKKYDEKFINIKGKSVDANLLAKFLEFSKCIKNVLPVLNVMLQGIVGF